MNAHSTRFLHRRAGSAISGRSPKLLPSSLARRLLLDMVYWTFTIILNFEDGLGSSIQFQKLIQTTSFKPRANNQHLDWVNPTAADLREVWHIKVKVKEVYWNTLTFEYIRFHISMSKAHMSKTHIYGNKLTCNCCNCWRYKCTGTGKHPVPINK